MSTSSARFRGRRILLSCFVVLGTTGMAFAQETLAFKNLQLAAGGYLLKAENAEIAGSTLPRAEVEAALKSGDPTKLVERLGKLGASSVTFSALRIERTESGPPRALGFAKLVLTGLAEGKIRTLQGTEGTWRNGTGRESSFANVAASGLDGAFLLGIVGDRAPAAEQSEPLVKSATIERFETRPSAGLWMSAQKISLNDVRVMPRGKSQFGALGALEISDLRFPVPTGGAQVSRGEVRVRSLVLGADKVDADDVPARYRARIDDLAFPLSANDQAPTIRNLRDLGLEQIVASAAIEANWTVAKKELKFDRLGINFQNLGAITLSGTLTNVAPDTFTESGAAAQERWGQALVQGMSVVLQNTGLYERAVARTARSSGRSPEEVRKQISTTSAQAIRQVTAGVADKTVPDAMIRFFEAPRSLTVSIQPKAGAVLPFSALLAKGGMANMADKVQVKAVAE